MKSPPSPRHRRVATPPPSAAPAGSTDSETGGAHTLSAPPDHIARPLKGTEATPLSKREVQIATLIAEGKTNKEISVALDLSIDTVGTHRKNICRKMNFHCTAELVSFSARRFRRNEY